MKNLIIGSKVKYCSSQTSDELRNILGGKDIRNHKDFLDSEGLVVNTEMLENCLWLFIKDKEGFMWTARSGHVQIINSTVNTNTTPITRNDLLDIED